MRNASRSHPVPKAMSGLKNPDEQMVQRAFKAFLGECLTGRNRDIALLCLEASPSFPGLNSVGATHFQQWNHRKMEEIEGDRYQTYEELRKLFRELHQGCLMLVGNARAFRASKAAQRWVRPEPHIGNSVYSLPLWEFKIPQLWEAADADALLGSSLGTEKDSDPHLMVQLEALGILFAQLDGAADKLVRAGVRDIFAGEEEGIIEQLHLNCLSALHAHQADKRGFRHIAKVIHWFVTGEEPKPEWGKRAATRARARFKAHLERTSPK